MKFRLAFLAVVTALLTACGNNAPELNQIYNQVNFVKIPDEVGIRAELLVLVNADDEDGDDDIASLHVIRDRDEFSWSVDSGSWTARDNRGMKWTGCQGFSMIGGGMPVSGEYRVLVTDNAGERAEDSIFVPVIKKKPAPEDFAELTFNDMDRIEIKSPQERNIVSFYDSDGVLLSAYAASPGELRIKTLRDGNIVMDNYRSVKVAYYSNLLGAGLIQGPYERP